MIVFTLMRFGKKLSVSPHRGRETANALPHPARMLIIHGRNDEVVPIENSRRYAARYPDQTQLVEVDSDHRLNDQLDLIWERVQSFLLD